MPKDILTEKKIRRIFGDTVKNVWIPREAEDLDKLVDEREQTARRLEKAEILLIKKANVGYKKDLKARKQIEEASGTVTEKVKAMDVSISPRSSNSPVSPIASPTSEQAIVSPMISTYYGAAGPPPDVNGSVAAQWVPAEDRPRHRPLANYGRRVDTIKWTRDRLKVLAPKISKLRRQYRKGHGNLIAAVFIEFHSQLDAQAAYQVLAHHRASHMEPDIVGVRPNEIVWTSLYMTWWEKIIRRFLIQGLITVMVIFWTIPSAMVGFVSQIKNLTKLVPFLGFLNKLPTVILALISGLLPAIALKVLMSLVPCIMRCK